MSYIKEIEIDGNLYQIKDEVARESIANIEDCSNTTFSAALIDLLYPVGSLYLSVNNNVPFSQGSWVKFGEGKALVGVKDSDTLMNAPEKTFGQANSIIPAHTHSQVAHSHKVDAHHHGPGTLTGQYYMRDSDNSGSGKVGSIGYVFSAFNQWSTNGTVKLTAGQTASASPNTNTQTPVINGTGEDISNKNYQPSIAVYIWKRVA